jgi:3-hydroxyisobutyrate dehydrogenase-like beta-hydroxyacid dehydrogenase
MSAIAFVGIGELACSLAGGLTAAGAADVRGYSRPRSDPAAAQAQRRRAQAAGIAVVDTLAEALRGATTVLATVPAGAALEVATAAAGALEPGAVYVDTAPLHPDAKLAAAGAVAARGGAFVDAAVLGTVATEGARVSIVAAGPGAQAFGELANGLGLNVSVLDGPPGQAARLKLLRSVFMKGRDALVMEMLLAARAHGIERALVDSIQGAGERVPFPQLADRIVCAMAVHAGRRADELELSAELVRDSGVEPLLSEAGAERLRRLAELGLREHFGGERPTDPEEVLTALDLLRARPGASNA